MRVPFSESDKAGRGFLSLPAVSEHAPLPPPIPSDDEVLDRVFDEALEICAAGEEPDPDALAAGMPDLREDAAEVVRTARFLAVQAPRRPFALPGYEVLATLGRGGGGTVFLARQRDLGRPVALKILGAAASASERGRERFRAEARALAKLRHPGVVAIHDVIETDGVLAYAMEWIDGRSLEAVLRRGGPPAASGEPGHAAIVRLMASAARALQAVHDAGVIHRDLKPSNILLRRDGSPVLADFGLARDEDRSLGTEAGRFLGTAAYAAPEQLRGASDAIDARTDVYGLGATLFDALAGHPPFPAASAASVLLAVERRGVPRLRSVRREVPRDLATVVAAAMAPDPADRYASAAAFAGDLERILEDRPIVARPVPWTRRACLLVRRRRAALLAAAAAAVLVGIASFFVAAGAAKRNEERRLLPLRVAAKLREARLLLLDPEHGERAFTEARGMGPPNRAPAWSAAALSVYDQALALDPTREDIRRERSVVASAEARRRGAPPSGPAPEDPRSRGLFAFLAGDEAACRAAWTGLDLRIEGSDALVDAALGQMLLQRDRPGAAYPRLHAAVNSFPEAGFLLVDLADAAQRSGDVDRALGWLRLARERGLLDRYSTDRRIEGECLARQGDLAGARRLLESVAARFGAPTCRSRLADLALREGRFEETLRLRREAFEHSRRTPGFAGELLASVPDLWPLLDSEARARILADSLEGIRGGQGLVSELIAAVGSAAADSPGTGPDSTTTAKAPSSPGWWAAFADDGPILEIHFMLTLSDRPLRPGSASALVALARQPGFRKTLPPPLRLGALFVACFLACSPAPAQFTMNLEFNEPGWNPSATPNLTIVGDPALLTAGCGRLMGRTMAVSAGEAFLFMGHYPGTSYPTTVTGLFNAAHPITFEFRLHLLDMTTIPGAGGFQVAIGSPLCDQFSLGFDAGGMFAGNGGTNSYVPIPGAVGSVHTYRMEVSTAGYGDVFIDGAHVYGSPLVPFGAAYNANGFRFGDLVGWLAGANADVDVDWLHVRQGPPCDGPGQANSDAARLEINGAAVGNCKGPFTLNGVSGGTLTFAWSGPPGMPFLLAHGPPNPANNNVACLGRIDIGTPPFYGDLHFLMDGTLPFYSLFYSLDPSCGLAQQTYSLPLLPPGTPIGGFQGLVIQPPGATCPAVLTAAWFLNG